MLRGAYGTVSCADVSDLELADKANVNVEDGSNDEQLLIQLGMLLLEASFGSLAWPGVYARNRITPFGAVIHAQIVGAQVSAAAGCSRCWPKGFQAVWGKGSQHIDDVTTDVFLYVTAGITSLQDAVCKAPSAL